MIVLDASVTVKWFASEPGSAEARSLVRSDEELVAPELMQVEVASALVKKAIRQKLNL
jgi:predicted nucleic acid-binding protein